MVNGLSAAAPVAGRATSMKPKRTPSYSSVLVSRRYVPLYCFGVAALCPWGPLCQGVSYSPTPSVMMALLLARSGESCD
jgi:hypothetical protein